MITAEQMLAPVEKLAGERETGGGNNTTVNKYWGVVGQAYCVYTILYANKVSGVNALSGYGGSGNCRQLGEFLTAKGYRLSDNSKAQKGDIAFYCEYNKAEKRWMYQHVFFIYEHISGTKFVTLEGNTMVYSSVSQAKGSAVGTGAYEGIGYKMRNMPTSGTWAIFHIPYDGKKTPTVSPRKTATVTLPYLECGDTGNSVKALQVLLNASGYPCGKADGDFGNGTKSAVVKFQRDKKISADGVVGKQTWESLMK